MTIENDRTYPTKDTSEAAWLHSQGFSLVDIQRDYTPLKFVFEKSDALAECVRQWQVGKALGNCCLYEQSRRKLMNMIHSPKIGEVGNDSRI
jgi:hypothetical protein